MPPTTKLTQQEKEACIVLSTLFLDTDLNYLRNYMSFSLCKIEPEIPISTLEHILHYDLFPILFPNCFPPAGEWAGFDKEWLIERVEAGRSRSWLNPWRWIRGIICAVAWQIVGTIVIWPDWLTVKEDVKRRREQNLNRSGSEGEFERENGDGLEELGVSLVLDEGVDEVSVGQGDI